MTARQASSTGETLILDQNETISQVGKEYARELENRGIEWRLAVTWHLQTFMYVCRSVAKISAVHTDRQSKGGVIYF